MPSRLATEPVDGEHLAHLGGEVRRDLGERGIVDGVEFELVLLGVAHERTGDLVRVAERHVALHEPLGDIGREREPGRRELGHALGVEASASRSCR